MVDDRNIVPATLPLAILNSLPFGHPGIDKMCNDAALFWWPNIWADNEKKSRTSSTFLNDGKNLSSQKPQTKQTKIEPPKTSGEEMQFDFT